MDAIALSACEMKASSFIMANFSSCVVMKATEGGSGLSPGSQSPEPLQEHRQTNNKQESKYESKESSETKQEPSNPATAAQP